MNRCFASIDFGSNSLRFVIFEIDDNLKLRIVYHKQEPLRLILNNGRFISDEYIGRAVGIFTGLKNICKPYNCLIKAVATSVIRRASNNKKLIDEIHSKANIPVEVIDGKREAELIYKGIDYLLNIKDEKIFCIDIGGGSAELAVGLNGKVLFSASLELGAVQLSELFFPDFILTERRINECTNYVKNIITPFTKKINSIGYGIVAASSGTAQTALSVINSPGNNTALTLQHNNIITKTDFIKLKELIFSKTKPEERLSIEGLSKHKADIIPAGILVLDVLREIFNIDEIKISDAALCEGLAAEYIQSQK